MPLLKFLDKIIVRTNTVIMLASLAAIIGLGLMQVILRNFFDLGFIWADIVIRNLVLWVGFSGAVVATSKGRHISIGALVKFLPAEFKRASHVAVSLFTSVVCFFLTYASYQFVKFEKGLGSTMFGVFPSWIAELIIPWTFVLIGIQFLIHSMNELPEEL